MADPFLHPYNRQNDKMIAYLSDFVPPTAGGHEKEDAGLEELDVFFVFITAGIT